jgi:hypothetical protein
MRFIARGDILRESTIQLFDHPARQMGINTFQSLGRKELSTKAIVH